ncbi:hypothetical protein HG531_014048 [Fusarium graminearum]|nr:hypothetical protein HG531_014048 [Fusarium graminearum]
MHYNQKLLLHLSNVVLGELLSNTGIGLGLIKSPETTSLISLAIGGHANNVAKLLKDGILSLDSSEVLAIPGATLRALHGAHVALSMLDLALLSASCVHVTLLDCFGYARPSTTGLERMLLIDGSDVELSLSGADGVLDKRSTKDQTLNMQAGKGDQVGLDFARGKRDAQDGMSDLLDDDGALEGGFLGVITFKLNTSLVVANTVCSGRRMMADLL